MKRIDKSETCSCGAQIEFITLDGKRVPVELHQPSWAPAYRQLLLTTDRGKSYKLLEANCSNDAQGIHFVLIEARVPHWPHCRHRQRWEAEGCPPMATP